MHRSRQHLRRLDYVWRAPPIYFITTCTAARRPLLANEAVDRILRDEFAAAADRYGWLVGRFTIMPDHLHVFCAPGGSREATSMAIFVGGLKQWSAKRIAKSLSVDPPIWQAEFFDHLLRSQESYEDKWRYVVENPVRAGLVARSQDWQFAGEIHGL